MVCLNCALNRASLKYQVVRHLVPPIVYRTTETHKTKIFKSRMLLENEDTIGVGFCLIRKQFEVSPEFWPAKSTKI